MFCARACGVNDRQWWALNVTTNDYAHQTDNAFLRVARVRTQRLTLVDGVFNRVLDALFGWRVQHSYLLAR